MGKLAVVGTGFAADRIVRAAAATPEHRFVGAWDDDVERLTAFSAHWSVPAARGLEDLFAGQKRPGLLLNLAPLSTRAAVTAAALAAALPVWSLEPLAPTLEEADALVRQAVDSRATLASGPSALLAPMMQTALAAVRRRAIGMPELVVADWETGYLAQAPFNEWRSESGAPWPAEETIREGVVVHHAGMPVAALLAMFGPVRTITATTTTLVPDKGGLSSGPDFTSAILGFDGVLARLTVSAVGRRVSRIRVSGPRGTLVADSEEGAVRIDRRNVVRGRLVEGWTKDPIPLASPPDAPRLRWRPLPEGFFGPAETLAAIDENRAPRLSGDLALHLTEVMLALNEAGLDAGPRAMTTAFEPMQPMPWARVAVRRTRRRERSVETIRIGIVGTGAFAADIAEAIRHDPRLDMDVVVGASQEEADGFASAAEIERAGTSLESALTDDIGAIILTEPFAAEAAFQALAAGKPVLAAAPFARSEEEAARLYAAAREARVPIVEALWSAYLPAHRRAAELAAGGTLGSPLHLALDLGTPIAREGNPALVQAGVLRALMPHALALAFELFGDVVDVDAAVTEENGSDVHASLLLRHTRGGVSQLAASFTTLMSNSARIGLTEGSIRIDDPVLAAEALAVKRVTSAAAPTLRGVSAPTLVGGARTEIAQRLRRSGVMRRVNRAVSLPRMETAGFGAHQLSPLLTHFARLATEKTVESDIVPSTRTLEILRLLDAVRPASAPVAPPARPAAPVVPTAPEPAAAAPAAAAAAADVEEPSATASVPDAVADGDAASAPETGTASKTEADWKADSLHGRD